MNPELVKFLRASNNLSVRMFAKKVQVSYSLISRIEGGDRRLTPQVERKIKSAFALTDEKMLAIKMLINQIKN